MNRVVPIVCLFLLVCVADSAVAQVGQLCLFADPQGLNCTISDRHSQLLRVYVVHTQAAGATAVTFSAPKPACMTGATWIGDTAVFPITIGHSQRGMTVGYGACLPSPIHVLTIQYMTTGSTAEDCPYQILPDPYDGLTIVDCNFNERPGQVSTTYINSTLPCACDMPGAPQLFVRPTTLVFGSEGAAMSFEIQNVGGGTLSWTVSESEPWLDVSPTSGTNNATVSVTVDRSSLPVGSYTGSVSVVSNAGTTNVTAYMFIEAPPVLGVTPTSLQIPATSSVKAISIWNDGGGRSGGTSRRISRGCPPIRCRA